MATTVNDEPARDNADLPGGFRAQPAHRQRVADHVFETLARAILEGELKAGEPLDTQRDLAQQFNVSALVVRQAIHRLEDLGLVRVRQGSPTIVLDPNDSADIRLLQLRVELSEPGPRLSSAALETQALFVVPLLALAERRISPEEVAVLRYLTERLSENASPEESRHFRREFWRQIAKATRNPLFQQQVRWWSSLLSELDRRGTAMHAPPGLNVELYRRLTDALAAHKGAVTLWLESIKQLLAWVEAQQGS